MTETLYWAIQAVSLVLLCVMAIFTALEWRPILAIAAHTWKESVRKKSLWLVMIFVVTLFFAFTFLEGVGPEVVREERRIRIILQMSLLVMNVFAVLAAIFLTSLSLPSDIADRRLFTLLSKPLSRWGLMCGKVLGFSFFTFVMLALMGLCMAVFVRWTARSAPPEVKQRMLGARESIQAQDMMLLAWRRGHITPERVHLPMRPDVTPGSMFRYQFRTKEVGILPVTSKGVPVRFGLERFFDLIQRMTEEGKGLAAGGIVFELIDPRTNKPAMRLSVPIQVPEGISEDFYVPREFFAGAGELPNRAEANGNQEGQEISLGIRVLQINPRLEPRKNLHIREAETGRWVFTGLSPSQVAIETVTSEQGDGAGSSAGSPAPASGKRIDVLVQFRTISKSGYHTGNRKIPTRFWYRLSGGELRSVDLVIRDARPTTFSIPIEALSDDGALTLDLENPVGTKVYYGYDNAEYTVAVLSGRRSFEFNILKAVVMQSFQVILLVVVAVSASTFLSWPVTSLTALFVYFCGELVSRFGEMITLIKKGGGGHSHGPAPVGPPELTIVDHITKAVLEVLRIVVPDMDKFSPINMVTEGYSVPFGELMRSFLYMNIFVTLTLAVGWLIFRRRPID